VLTRRPRQAGDIAWNPDAPSGEWRSAIAAADAVVNLAGESLDKGRWTEARKAAILSSRVNATRAIVKAMADAPTRPATFLNASAVGVYGRHGDEALTEESSGGSGFLASVCEAWESAALEAAWMTRVVLLRSGIVLDRSGGALPRLELPVRLFAGGPVGSGRQYWSWIHRTDWTRMVQWALATSEVKGPLNVTAPSPATNRELVKALGRALERPVLAPPVPGFAIRLALGEMADEMVLAGQRVLPEKATRGGFEFLYPDLDSALHAIYRDTPAR
jgi:uncharacterized protein (TIGR01777 family)